MNERPLSKFLGALQRLINDKDTDWESILMEDLPFRAEWREFKTRPGYWAVGNLKMILQMTAIYRYAEPEALESQYRVMDRIVEAGCQDNS